MGRYVLRRDIAATPARVFKAFTEPPLIADWMDAAEIRDVSGPLDVAGSEYTLVIFGPWRFRTAVVRSDPSSVHETVHLGPLGTSVRMVGTLSEHPVGTRLELLTEYAMPLGALGGWIDRRWIDREPRPTANREIDRLVTLVSDPTVVPQPRGASRAGAAIGSVRGQRGQHRS